MWLDGEKPQSKYWIDDLDVTIKDAKKVFDVEEILAKGAPIRAASTLWSFHFLYERGGLFCDVDHVALKHFPDDEWILSSGGGEDIISVGMMKVPSGSEIFLDAIDVFKPEWGIIPKFTKICWRHGKDKTHPIKEFFPWQWQDWATVLENRPVPDSYSLHLYGKMIDDLELDKQEIRKKYPDSMLNRLVKRFCD